MHCKACHFKICTTHKVPFHDGESCAEFDQRMKAENDANAWMLEKVSKKCPGCQCDIEKIEGCEHMSCKSCKRRCEKREVDSDDRHAVRD